MRKYTLRKSVITEGERVFVGIDAHKKSLHITVLSANLDERQPLHRESIPHSREQVEGLIRRLPGCQIVAAYEAGPTGYALAEWLRELGCDAFITPPSRMLEDSGRARIKTDERDSFRIADQARNNQLIRIHELGRHRYQQRELERTREQLVHHRSSLKMQIKSKLLFHGVALPEEIAGTWNSAHMAWLWSKPCGATHVDDCIESLLRCIDHFDKEIKRLDGELKKLARSEEFADSVAIVASTPGISVLGAMTLLLELGDISRFDKAEEFSSFLGLIPGEWSSGETKRKRGLVRWGNRRVRTRLVEGSWIAIRKDPGLRALYERIKSRSGAGPAIVAVARRLALTIRAMVREHEPYRLRTA